MVEIVFDLPIPRGINYLILSFKFDYDTSSLSRKVHVLFIHQILVLNKKKDYLNFIE